MAVDHVNDFRSGDMDNNVLRKILGRLNTIVDAVETNTPNIVINPADVDIGTVIIGGADGVTNSEVRTTTPNAGDGGLVVRNIPSGTQMVSVANFPATQPVSGTVAVSNLPATQPVSGTVAVSNLPATQTVDGTVSVGNFPATQPVSGAVSVSNFPATQPVSGSVSVANFPASQVVVDSASNPAFLASRYGLIDGKAAKVYHVLSRRAGFNSNTLRQDIAEFLVTSVDLLPELTGAESFEIVSSSASDTALGTGAQSVTVCYLNTSNVMTFSAPIPLAGATPVAVAWKANFIYYMEIQAVGTGRIAAGNILLRIAGAGVSHEQITAGNSSSLSGRFMIPAGHTGYLIDWGAGIVGNATHDLRLRATVDQFTRNIATVYHHQSIVYLEAPGAYTEELPWLSLPALSRVKVSTNSSETATSNRVDAEFSLLVIAN